MSSKGAWFDLVPKTPLLPSVILGMSRRKFCKWAILVFVTVVWAALVITVGVMNSQEGEKKASNIVTGALNPRTLTDGIKIGGNITYISLINYAYTAHFTFTPVGSFLSRAPGLFQNTLAVPTTITIGGNSLVFPANLDMKEVDLTFTMQDGDVNKYPIDVYSGSWSIRGFAFSTSSNASESVPLAYQMNGALISWDIGISIQDNLSTPPAYVKVSISRSLTTKFFSLFVVLIMWLLSLCILIVAIILWLRDRKVDPPVLGVAAAIIFALPAIRNVQPGAPPIGCTSDVVGFFWTMLISTLAAVMLLVNYIRKYANVHTPPSKSTVNVVGSSALKPVSVPLPATSSIDAKNS